MGKNSKKPNNKPKALEPPQPAGCDILALVGKHRKSIMGFAALYILFFHEYQLLFNPNSAIYQFQNALKKIGFMGVDMFFLLSGIGLMYSINKTRLRTFYYKRLRRIMFPFVCVGIIRAIVDKWPFESVIFNLTGINFYAKSMYSFLWFVPAIATFYLLFPLYNKLMNKAANKITFTAVIICVWLLVSMLCADFMNSIGRTELYGFTNRIPVFIIGVLFGYLAQNKKLIVTKLGWVLIVMMNLTGCYLAMQTNFHGWSILVPVSNCCVPNLLMSVSLVFILAKLFDIISAKTAGRGAESFFGFFGMISLEFYCIQEFLALKILGYIPSVNPALKNLISFAAVTAAATAIFYAEKGFWFLIELPGKRRKKS